MESLNNAILAMMDMLLGWMLSLPRDVVLVIVAAATSAVLTFVRPLVTNQRYLHRCKLDKKRLGELISEARARGDKEAVRRHRQTIAMIGIQTMKAEGKPLLAVILPIAVLCVWCFARMGHFAPQPGAAVEVRAYLPASAVGKVAQLLPQDGLTTETGWAQRIVEDPVKDSDNKTSGLAVWKVRPQTSQAPRTYTLQFRFQDDSVSREYLADPRRCSAPVEVFPDHKISAVEYVLRPYKPLGLLPDVPLKFTSLDAWLAGYLIIAIPLAFLLRWMFNIC